MSASLVSNARLIDRALNMLMQDSGNGQVDDDIVKNAARLHFQPAMDAFLQMHPWSFAVRREQLDLIVKNDPKWPRVYAVPLDCIQVHEVYAVMPLPQFCTQRSASVGKRSNVEMLLPPNDRDGRRVMCEPVRWEFYACDTDTGFIRSIGTCAENALSSYTSNAITPDMMSPLAQEAFVSYLCYYFNASLRGFQQDENRFVQAFDRRFQAAVAMDVKHISKPVVAGDRYTAARLGVHF